MSGWRFEHEDAFRKAACEFRTELRERANELFALAGTWDPIAGPDNYTRLEQMAIAAGDAADTITSVYDELVIYRQLENR